MHHGETFPLGPVGSHCWGQALAGEAVFTFVLCFVVLSAATAETPCRSTSASRSAPASPRAAWPLAASRFYDLAIGFAIVAGGYGAGAISGGCFNPAVALGLDISSAFQGIRWDPIYCGCEVGGACLAAGLFRVDRPDDFGGSPDYGLSTKCVSEFIGAYALVFTIGLNVLGGVPAGAWSIAASLICIVYALGSCSGAPSPGGDRGDQAFRPGQVFPR